MNKGPFGLYPDIAQKLIEVRRLIHERPELSHEEHETSALVRRELEAVGLSDLIGLAGTGIIVNIKGEAGPSNTTLALRADLDALPITERTRLSYKSKRPAVMHACGHDTHTAMVLAVALTFQRRRESFQGVVRCIFQPAEEAEPLGGRQIVEQGHINDVDGVIGIHVDPLIEKGRIGVAPGVYSCTSDEFDIEVLGRSSHGGRPHEGVDAIVIACGIVQEVQKVPSRQSDPTVPLIITVGSFHGGSAHNIVAERVNLKGTIRAGDKTVRALAHERLCTIAEALAKAHGGKAVVTIRDGEPAIENHPAMVELIRRAGNEVGGDETVFAAPRWTASDDFGFYAQQKPSVYFRLGVRNEQQGCIHPLHHPEFTVDEDALTLGAAVLVRATELFLSEPRNSQQSWE